MVEHFTPQIRANALRGTGSHGLAGKRGSKTHNAQQHQQTAPLPNVGYVMLRHTNVNHVRHDKGHNQLEDSFDQLEHGTQNHLQLVWFQKPGKLPHFFSHPFPL